MAGLGPLNKGGRVAIIGGGPGGVGCALALQRMAAESGRHIQVTLFEGKQFHNARHHNLCVGVVSSPLPTLMEETLGVPCPTILREGIITGYVLHTRREQILLEDVNHPAYALRRVKFDAYMLDMARQRGIRIVPARVVAIEFHADRVILYSEAESAEADVVVGAFGMDEGAAALFHRAVGYHQPKALYSVLTRYHPGPNGLARFGPRVHAFLDRPNGIEFGAITPKGDHLTINIAGLKVGAETMRRFLADPEVSALLPPADPEQNGDPTDFQVFKGRFPCSLARNYYGDRYVMVGDAAGLVRAFKGKGMTSAVQTGIRAAETILRVGISQHAFATHYEASNKDIIGDLSFGHAVRLIVLLGSRLGLLDPVVRAARREPAVRKALYGAVSAHEPYRQVLHHVFSPSSIAAVLQAMLSGWKI